MLCRQLVNNSDETLITSTFYKSVKMLDWTYAGVDYSIPGNGGQECVKFLSVFQRVAESLVATLLSIKFISNGYQQIVIPDQLIKLNERNSASKRILLILHCLVFGTELGFKLASRQMIWVLNPCHIITMVQIFLLAAPPSKFALAIFRLHMYMLSGAPLALLFPVINTRLLEFEKEIYYIQHILMLIVPVYLLRLGGIYTCEDMNDLSWASVAIGIIFIYHFVPLQIIASLSQVNLNNMLCPAVSDPFSGPMYRIFAIIHQAVSLPFMGKLLNWIGLQLSLDRQEQSSQVENDKDNKFENSEPASTFELCKDISVSSLSENPANGIVNTSSGTVLRRTMSAKKDTDDKNVLADPNPIPCPDMFRQNYAVPGSIIADPHSQL